MLARLEDTPRHFFFVKRFYARKALFAKKKTNGPFNGRKPILQIKIIRVYLAASLTGKLEMERLFFLLGHIALKFGYLFRVSAITFAGGLSARYKLRQDMAVHFKLRKFSVNPLQLFFCRFITPQKVPSDEFFVSMRQVWLQTYTLD